MDARNGTRAKRVRRARAQQLYVRTLIGESVKLQEEQCNRRLLGMLCTATRFGYTWTKV